MIAPLLCPIHAEDPRDCGCPPPKDPDPEQPKPRRKSRSKFSTIPDPGTTPGPAFVASYDGRCTECGGEIEADVTMIRADGHGGYEHADGGECF